MATTVARPTVFTLPNLISSSRVALAIGFVASEAVPTRLALIGIASLTDFLDGWVARRTKVASRFGALLDPVAGCGRGRSIFKAPIRWQYRPCQPPRPDSAKDQSTLA